jgi:integrase
LAWTGARVSEVLALTRISFQVESGIVAVHTLKQRRHVVREVPIPPELMQALDRRFKMSAVSGSPDKAMARLWPWSRIDPRGGNMLIAAESYAAR